MFGKKDKVSQHSVIEDGDQESVINTNRSLEENSKAE
jgi:hypothetical protein